MIAMTGEASESQRRIQKQLAKVVQSHYKSGELGQEYDGNYLIQVSQENYNLEAFVLVSQSLLTLEPGAEQIQIIHPADVPSIAICVNNILIQFSRISRSAEPHHNSLFSKIAILIM